MRVLPRRLKKDLKALMPIQHRPAHRLEYPVHCDGVIGERLSEGFRRDTSEMRSRVYRFWSDDYLVGKYLVHLEITLG
jgi:hypothetical protein